MRPDGLSQICEGIARIGNAGLRALATGVFVLHASLPSWAVPEDDYQAGAKAYRTGDQLAAAVTLRRAADAGHAPAQALLASILDQAEFNEEAVGWYRKAAEQGDPDGQYGLGAMYLAGEGVKQDLPLAYAWFVKAGEKNSSAATVALAGAYLRAEKGEVATAPERARAEEWLRKAAALDYLPAVDALALAYRAGGFDIVPDATQASLYTAQAQTLRKKMSPESAKKAKKEKVKK